MRAGTFQKAVACFAARAQILTVEVAAKSLKILGYPRMLLKKQLVKNRLREYPTILLKRNIVSSSEKGYPTMLLTPNGLTHFGLDRLNDPG